MDNERHKAAQTRKMVIPLEESAAIGIDAGVKQTTFVAL